MDVLVWTTIIAFSKLISVLLFPNFFACALCSDAHNFFVVYQILAYE
jgi:hypothetical protein